MKRILQPVIQNIPLFLISILLMGGFDVLYHQYIFHELSTTSILVAFQEIIIMAYLICLCSSLLIKIHIKVFFYFVLFIIYSISCYLIYAFGVDITPDTLLILFETNRKEISGFFQAYFLTPAMFKTLFVLIALLISIIVGEYYNKRISQLFSKPIFIYLIAIILLFGGFGLVSTAKRYFSFIQCKKAYDVETWRVNYLFYKGMPIPNLLYSVSAIHFAGQDLNYMIEATKESLKDVEPYTGDSLNIVLVIGESFNKYHSGLYGYSLNTTPNQCEEQKKGNLYAFTNVKAIYNMTSIVLKNMFCCNNIHAGERWYDHPYFPAIFTKAGYKVWLWDNQYQVDSNLPWNFTLNSVMFNEQIQQLSYTAINTNASTYDDGLIDDFRQKKLSELGRHNLIIFHLYGQHRPTNKQYPQEKENFIFSHNDIKSSNSFLNERSRKMIADYANATYYNDKVIKHIIDIFRETNTIMIYFSDHGEEVYDYRNFYGRSLLEEENITPNLIKYQLEVPFIVWGSDYWIQNHQEEWQTIGLAIDKQFTTDILCHLLLRLAGIKTKVYMSTHDLFSPEYVPQIKDYNNGSFLDIL